MAVAGTMGWAGMDSWSEALCLFSWVIAEPFLMSTSDKTALLEQ